jgi:hypothetical protein
MSRSAAVKATRSVEMTIVAYNPDRHPHLDLITRQGDCGTGVYQQLMREF